jgi:Cytochrome P460
MTRTLVGLTAAAAASLTVAGGVAIADNKDTVAVPNGYALSEFKGFEDWQMVGVSQATPQGHQLIEVILGNPTMIETYKAGFPANGKPVPDGARMVKIHWNAKKSAEDPGNPLVPDTLHDIDTMVKDSKRFAATGGWGYGQFNYDAATDTFSPLGTGAACGYACHNIVKAKDYVFTTYPKR